MHIRDLIVDIVLSYDTTKVNITCCRNTLAACHMLSRSVVRTGGYTTCIVTGNSAKCLDARVRPVYDATVVRAPGNDTVRPVRADNTA